MENKPTDEQLKKQIKAWMSDEKMHPKVREHYERLLAIILREEDGK